MDFLNQGQGQGYHPYGEFSDSVILRHIFNQWNQISFNGTIPEITINILYMIIGVIFAVFIKKQLSNTDILMTVIYNFTIGILKTILYKEISISKKYSKEKYASVFTESRSVYWGVNLYFFMTHQEIKIKYIPIIHNKHVNKLINEARAKCENNKEKIYMNIDFAKINNGKNFAFYQQNSYNENLFRSCNIENIGNILTNILKRCRKIKNNRPFTILIDGEPGLGKSSIKDFVISNLDEESKKYWFRAVYYIDLTNFISMPFDDIIKLFYHDVSVNTPTYFHVDELDKYVDQRIEIEYEELKKKTYIRSKSTGKDKNDNNDEIYDANCIPTKEEFVVQQKRKILFQLLTIPERTSDITKPCVIIFCSNNFDTIFEGIDKTHFDSLKDRFTRVSFKRCHRDEIIKYLSYYNDIMGGIIKLNKGKLNKNIAICYDSYDEDETIHESETESDEEDDDDVDDSYYPPDKFKNTVSKLVDDITIPYRKLSQIYTINKYDIELTIEGLNEYNLKYNRDSNDNPECESTMSDSIEWLKNTSIVSNRDNKQNDKENDKLSNRLSKEEKEDDCSDNDDEDDCSDNDSNSDNNDDDNDSDTCSNDNDMIDNKPKKKSNLSPEDRKIN